MNVLDISIPTPILPSLIPATPEEEGSPAAKANPKGNAHGHQKKIEGDNAYPKTRGVIQLLEEGHFKGVADVRLRINFFDELSARAGVEAQGVAQEQTRSLADAVTAEVDAIAENAAADESTTTEIAEAKEAFTTAVEEAGKNLSADQIDPEALAETLSSAFNELVEKLGTLLAPPEAPEPVEEPGDNDGAITDPQAPDPGATTETTDVPPETTDVDPTAPEEEDAFDLDAALASLREVFDEALTNLLDSVTAALTLPDPSEPRGNGAAYDKFLAIYNEMRGLGEPADAPAGEEPPAGPIDVTA